MTSLPRFSVNNPVLVNLFMWAIIIAGVFCAFTLVREMFPESDPNEVHVNVVYPGATPAEIEKGIVIKIEEAIKDIEDIEEIRTTIGEGACTIAAVLYNNVEDVDQAVTDVKAAIDTIPRDEFPEEAEEPMVAKFEPQLPVINVSFFGDLDEETLKRVGKQLRDDLLLVPGITDVVLGGIRKDEIIAEVRPEKLVEYGLSFMDVGDAIARANLDLPGGQIKTGSANVSVRTLGEEDQAEPIGEIIVRSDPSGKLIRLKEIAEVIDGFEDADVVSRFNAKPAVTVTVYKTQSQDAIDISKKVKALVAGKRRRPLERDWLASLKHRLGIRDEIEEVYARAYNDPFPQLGELKTSTNLARFIEGRLDLLKRNGLWGLIFVFGSLLLFLNWRVAFWVMCGLVLSVLGTLIALDLMGYTLNLMTMFGLIIVLGILVDDAIIVGEHVYTKIEHGVEPKLAAITGTEEVTWPVVCAVATTIVAFAPLMFMEGRIGDFMRVLPLVVLCALSVSLFEALTILPSHLAEWLRPSVVGAVSVRGAARADASGSSRRGEAVRAGASGSPDVTAVTRFRGWAERVRSAQAFFIRDILLRNYERLLRVCVVNRYVTVAALAAAVIVAVGTVLGGCVPFVFIQKMDSETVVASLKMPVGTPIEGTDRAIRPIEQATTNLPELDSLYTLLGTHYSTDGARAASSTHLGQAIIELKPIEERERTSEDIIRELRSKSRDLPGINALEFRSMQGGPRGAPVAVEINGDRLEDLVQIADRFKGRLRGYAGVYDIQDDFDAGRREIQIELLDSARALGLTTQSLATQVRAAFYGLEARQIQRDREDVKIMVRYPEDYRRRIYDVESMRIAAPDGSLVPFSEVACLKEGRGYATIKRKDQQRIVTVTADVDETVPGANASMINEDLAGQFHDLEREFPGVKMELGGQERERIKSFASLTQEFAAAILLIYVILAGLFRSYVQPIVVMCAIPFGLVGVVVGHYLMGYPLTIMSMIGLVALTGIVVNDSLILVSFINHRRSAGAPAFEAIIEGGRARLRAIILTSITTILGLAPLLTETSFQAKFLIPMGISIAAGLAFATVLTLVAVPSLYMISIDAKRALARLWAQILDREPALDAAA
ncbi:MAG: efflux RND transporter permease subunit [Phycisphaerae bacterium]|nr:efflux RND transporter permease subunit [Phycisphaerae bacterium]